MNSFCVVCEKPVEQFLMHGLPPRPGVCPHCGAKARHREMAYFYMNVVTGAAGERILEVGPSSATTKFFINKRFLKDAQYTALDVRELKHHRNIQAPHEFIIMDATAMKWPDNTFDYVFCNHVLPYIEQDQAALNELHRVLKPSGVAVLNSHTESVAKTRRMDDLQKENPAKYTADFLGENGTVWEYGQDYFERLKNAGFAVAEWDASANQKSDFVTYNGLKPQSRMTLGFKNQTAKTAFLQK